MKIKDFQTASFVLFELSSKILLAQNRTANLFGINIRERSDAPKGSIDKYGSQENSTHRADIIRLSSVHALSGGVLQGDNRPDAIGKQQDHLP